jgi:hypothetical protein
MVARWHWGTAALLAALLGAHTAAAITDAQKCEASKLKTAGKYGFCRLKAEAKAVKTGDPPDYSKCDGKYGDKWMQAEGGGSCPTTGDQTAQQAELSANANRTAWELSGQPRFADNADGTITDNETGLTWEKKTKFDGSDDLSNLHDADNYYPWSGNCSVNTSKYCQPTTAASTLCTANAEGGTIGCDECTGGDGTCSQPDTAWTLAVALNTGSFAGHTDWRVPKRRELEGILDLADGTPPAVDVAFQGANCGGACSDITDPACSCTRSDYYWSASTYAPSPQVAWIVDFDDGTLNADFRTFYGFSVRVVRGGS